MADLNLGDGLRKIVLAGIGALATTYEKSSEIVDELVKKGEITVEQGKALNTELKRKVSEVVDDAKTTAAESTAATADEDGTVKMYTDFAAAVMADGKIVAALNDAIQPNITIDMDGGIVDTAFKGTKRELKEDYGMAGNPYSSDNNGDGKILEWYEQSAAFSAYVVGMTADEVAGIQTQTVEGHEIAADDALLSAGCTIQITSIRAVMAQAAANVR